MKFFKNIFRAWAFFFFKLAHNASEINAEFKKGEMNHNTTYEAEMFDYSQLFIQGTKAPFLNFAFNLPVSCSAVNPPTNFTTKNGKKENNNFLCGGIFFSL